MNVKYSETTILFLILFVCVVATAWDEDFVKEPYGPKMCERLCKIAGCSFHIFSPSLLSCQGIKTSNRSKKIHIKACAKDNGSRNPECLDTPRNKNHATMKKNVIILVAPILVRDNKTTLRQLKLNQEKMSNVGFLTPYPDIGINKIAALATVVKQRKILVSRSEPYNHIESYNLYSKPKTIMVTHYSPISMSVDEEKQLVFSCSYTKIKRMTTDGIKVKKVFTPKSGDISFAVAVQSKYERLYVLFHNYIISIGYTGTKMQQITRGKFTSNVLYVGNTPDSVYFSRGKNLYMKAQRQREVKVTTFKSTPRRLVRVGEDYLITFKERLQIYFMERKVLIRWTYKETTSLEVCVIPEY